ncbi:P-loop containing nucleoside triphosphate hydrolase protein [Dioscorea alata]|uniref:P-loop containing nucleoside triphosphate hydrolase protein n=1 Tax=Dioscorea alata TaxID=55571 RepID=A0ACB7V2G2_DIOAL|nr:P-loop containing nucleoside triphosphate hydrolase protein [Dioscorea alata]
MADAAVGFVVEKLRNLIMQEAIILYGVRDEVECLERELQRLQCFLKDADAKKNKGDDERVKNWVTEMRDLAFQAEDIIDTFMYLKLRRQQRQPGCIGFIKRFVFMFDELVSRHKVHVDVEGIKAQLHELSKSREQYGIANIGEAIGETSQYRSQHVIPILPQLSDDIAMVGFDDEKKKIVQELVDINNTNRSVISLVGMGGLGKTTLAKSVYNDLEVKRNFNIFAWVIISQQYTILEILKGISTEVSATPLADTIQHLSIAISEKLEKGKYLIVLDDVWKEDVWNELQKVCPDVNNGSRVIITARSSNVINIADPTAKLHKLRCLNENEAWVLFLRKAFPKQDIKTCCSADLIEYAHQLVQRCGGLPLALVVLGGLVLTKPQTKDEWRKLVESMKGQFVEDGKRCLEILALSYNNLPYYLKSCVLYFGRFREDMNIPAQTLLGLWSAEGFLPKQNGKTTEEFGMDCLEQLAQRCLIQVTDRKYDGNARYCRIHDLLRDMFIKEAKENKYLEIYKNDTADHVTTSNAAQRLVIGNEIEILNYSNSKLRGLFLDGYYFDSLTLQTINRMLGTFKLLRVLSLYNTDNMLKFPSEIKSLIHLRYLELHTHYNMMEIPSWIDHLCNLQTFIIGAGYVAKISDSLWRIGSLRHVVVLVPTSFTPNMGNNVPKNLQTLKWVSAGPWIENMLSKLTNLRKLNIYGVSCDHANALSSSLPRLGLLASLSIQGNVVPSDNVIRAFSNQHCLKKLSLWGVFDCRQLPRSNVFPQQLVKLVLDRSGLEQDPMEILEKLKFLKYLTLNASCRGKQMICSATGFPQLLFLAIKNYYELEEWKIKENAMPCLKSLQIYNCPKLKMIPEELKNVPLDHLVLDSMPEKFMSRIKENTGEDWYKIQHVPNISIKEIQVSSFNYLI